MKKNTSRTFQWLLSILLIAWNLFDIFVHVRADLAEPLRISGNIVGIVAGLIVLFGVAKAAAPQILGGSAAAVFILNTFHSFQHGIGPPMLVFVGATLFMLLRLGQMQSSGSELYHRWWVALIATLVGVGIVLLSGLSVNTDIAAQLHDGGLESADYWHEEPLILSAGMGFDSIVGLEELTEASVRAAGGSWYGSLTCTNGEEPESGSLTSATLASALGLMFKGSAVSDDGLPIVFSWPVATETVDMTDFQFTLNTGEVMFANAAGMVPNWELSERNTVVLFADFGNRQPSSETDACYPVKLEIVEDDTPLLLIGPNGEEFNAVGLTWETDKSPYDAGPVLVGAKLN